MATFIPADITQPQRDVSPKNGKTFKLAELQSFVGGYIELLELPNDKVMVLNEEAKSEDQPQRNHRASEQVVFVSLREVKAQIEEQEARGIMVFHDYDFSGDLDRPADYIAGDVLICASFGGGVMDQLYIVTRAHNQDYISATAYLAKAISEQEAIIASMRYEGDLDGFLSDAIEEDENDPILQAEFTRLRSLSIHELEQDDRDNGNAWHAELFKPPTDLKTGDVVEIAKLDTD
jgi:hypothetical protein